MQNAWFRVLLAALFGVMLVPLSGHAAAPDADDDAAPASGSASTPVQATPPAPAARDGDDDDESAQPVTQITVVGQRMDAARASIDSALGAATYTLSNDAVEKRPGGETVSLGQVLLQAPGMTQDGAGQLRVRGQSDLEYRIDNVIIPESFGDLADTLSARLVDRVQLVTGALPAQYGLHSGGVVNITTKSGAYDNGGQAELYGGSHGTVEPAFEYAASGGATNVFVSGSAFHSDVGLGAADGTANPAHDSTDQFEGFAYLEHLIDDRQRLSLILGSSNEQFRLPSAVLDQDASARAAGGQRQDTQYGIASYQRTADRLTLQVSTFARYTSLTVDPAPLLDLEQTGQSVSAANRDTAAGLQAEAVYLAGNAHTFRSGYVVTADHGVSQAATTVQAGNDLFQPGVYRGDISDTRWENSLFLQDEWQVLSTVTLNDGLRLDSVSGTGGGTQLSPRLSVVWKAAQGLTAHVGYARNFVPAPDRDIAAAAGAPALGNANAVAPESRLRAETDDTVDVGAEQSWRGLTFGVDGYWRHASNLIDEQLLGPGSLVRPFYYAQGRLTGLETAITYRRGGFSAWSNLAVARAEGKAIESTGAGLRPSDVAYSQGHFIALDSNQSYTASAGGSYRWGKVQFSSDLLYGSGFSRTPVGAAPNSGSLPPSFQLNVAATYRLDGLQHRPLDLRLDLINALDRRNEVRDGSSVGAGIASWGPRRGLFAGLEQSF